MRNLILVALMGLTSSMAFANVDDRGDRGGRNDESEYSCWFKGERGLRCKAFVSLERERDSRPVADENRGRNGSSMALECNNEFELRDRNAKSEFGREGFIIAGHDDGYQAVIKALKRHDRHDRQDDGQEGGRGDKMRAELLISRVTDADALTAAQPRELHGYCAPHNDNQEDLQFLF